MPKDNRVGFSPTDVVIVTMTGEQLSSLIKGQTSAEPYMSGKDAAAYTSLSVGTLRDMVQRGELRAYRVGRGNDLRYKQSDLDNLMKPTT